MAAKIYNDRITKTTNWGGDASTGGNPVSGERVQEFVKNTLEEKVGEIYHDQVNSRYLCFADAENRDLYLLDRELHADKLIARFDAISNYSAELQFITPQSNPFLKGEVNKVLEFIFDIKNKQGASTGDSALVTFTISNGGSKQILKQVAQSRQNVTILLDDYLLDGLNTIVVTVVGRTTMATIMSSVSFTKIDLNLSSTFDYSIPLTTSELLIPFTVSGLGQKYIEWYVDSVKLPEEDIVLEPQSSRVKSIDIASLSPGAHSIQLRAYVVVSGERFYSKTFYFDITKGRLNRTVMISTTLPAGTVAPNTGPLLTAEQYEPLNIRFATYDPLQRTLVATFTLDGELLGSIETSNEEIQTFLHTPIYFGQKSLIITLEDVTKTLTINSVKSLAAIEETLAGIRVRLLAAGRTNSDINKAVWSDRGFSTTFNGFSWTEQSGWNNGALVIAKGSTIDINIKPFLPDMAVTGGAIEIDFETIDSENENALLCSCVDPNNNAGIRITATSASIRSSGGAFVETRFKNEERVKLAFIVNKAVDSPESGLIFIVNNGIVERATNYATSDTFLNGSTLTIGDSTGKTSMKIRSIRIYNRAITTDEAFANYVVDSGRLLQLYQENDIYEEGTTKVSVDKISSKLPVFIFTGPIPTLEASMDKNLRIYCDIEYINNQDPTKSFTTTQTRVRLQGTSSLGYPRKNFRFYTRYGEMFDYEGKKIEGGLYSFKDNAIPVSTWCLKADYAESSCTHNTGVARLWNDVLKNFQVAGQYVGKTQAQAAAEANQYPYDVRTCIDGFPCVMFYRLTPQSELVFMGQYNFNNDKSTENVFGFTDIPGFDNSKMQCWEVINNTHPLTLFKSVETFDTEWEDAFESRYPDDGSDADTSDLKAFSQWISGTATDVESGEIISINAEIKTDLSTQFQSDLLYAANGIYPDTPENRIKKFSKEKWDYLDVYKVAAYYVYLMRFGGVDQTVKNAMFTTEGTKGVGTKCKWFYINYDNDTVLGVRNDARLVYPYDIDRQSNDPLLPDTYAYAGHDSTLWNNLEADDEFMRIVREVDRGLYTAGLTYENVNRIFDQEQSGKWCARVYNDNGRYKYISTFKEQGINNLFMLQGTRKSHRHWWVTNRFNLFDALWVSGKYKSNVVEFKAPGATGSFTIQAGAIQRYGYGINNDAIETGIALLTGETKAFTPPRVLAIGDPVRIYAASSVQGINLSNYKENIAQLNVSGAYDEVGGSKLRRLILGDKNTENLALTDISGLNQLVNLEELDIRGFKGITSLNLSTLPSLKIVKLDNSGITSFQPTQGVKLDVLSLPSTLQVLSLDKTTINTTFTYTPTISLRTLSLKNTTGIDEKSLVLTWFDAIKDNELALQNASLTAWGINWENITPTQLIGLRSIGTLSLRGYIKLSSLTFQDMNDLIESFGPNVFQQTGELIIDAPPGIMLSGPAESLSATEATFTGVLFPVGSDSILYSLVGATLQIIDDQRFWVSGNIKINETTGVLTSDITINDTNVTIKATAANNANITGTLNHLIKARRFAYPGDVSISGSQAIPVDTSETFNITITNPLVDGPFTTLWSLDCAPNIAVISNATDTSCTVTGFENMATFNLSAAITNANTTTPFIKTLALIVSIPGVIMTNVTHPKIMAICYAQGWCANAGYMIEEEAAAVTDIGTAFMQKELDDDFTAFENFTGITTIPDYAFSGDYRLKSIKLPATITKIGKYAFDRKNTLDSVIFNEGLVEIDDYAFFAFFADFPITLPSTVRILRKWCFYTNSPTISLNEGLQEIHSSALKLYKVKEFVIPSTVTYLDTSIGQAWADAYNSLVEKVKFLCPPTSIYEGEKNEYYKGKFYSSAGIRGSRITSLSQVEMPGWTFIPDNMFGGSKLTSIVIPDGITKIGSSAFSNCANATSVFIPDSVVNIVGSPFYGCNIQDMNNFRIPTHITELPSISPPTGITNVVIPPHITKINQLKLASDFISFTIPPTVTDLTNLSYVDSFFTSLEGVPIPTSMKKLNSYMFSNCPNLINAIIPPHVEEFASYIFRTCSKLKTVTLPEGFKDLGPNPFDDCFAFESVNFPTSLKSISFSSCTFPMGDFTVPSTVNLKVNRMYGLPNITAFRINHSISGELNIGLSNCPLLETVEILNNAFTSLNLIFLGKSPKVKTIIIGLMQAPYVDSNAFGNTANTGTYDKTYTGRDTYNTGENMLYVPAGATGYDQGRWASVLLNPDCCGFTISYTL